MNFNSTPLLHMTTLFKLHLAPRDLQDVEAVAHDRFQSPRARKRSEALLHLHEMMDVGLVHRRTGVTPAQQQELIERLHTHGVQAAIFGSPRRHEQRRYDTRSIAAVAAECLKRRPPPGSLRWSLVHLTDEVRQKVPGAETITKETLRQIVKQELKIKSIRVIEPFWMQPIRMPA